jgi:hypothetical protein
MTTRKGMSAAIPYGDKIYELTGMEFCELEDILERKPPEQYEETVYQYLLTKDYDVEPPADLPAVSAGGSGILPNAGGDTSAERIGGESRDTWTKDKILREKEKILRFRERQLAIRRGRPQTREPTFMEIFTPLDLVKAGIMVFIFAVLIFFIGREFL